MSTPTDRVTQLVIPVSELCHQPGASRRLQLQLEAPTDLGSAIISIPPGRPVELTVLLESVMEGILASGQLDTGATGQCVRCLEPVELPIGVTFQELYSYPERAAATATANQDQTDTLEVIDQAIDLNRPVRDALVLALPFQPLCQTACPGLCATCGEMLVDPADHQHNQVDPRWSPLEEMLKTQVEES